MRATQMIRAGLTAIALLATNAATAQESYQFQWPDNPFAPTLSDDLFAPTNESRFNKAGLFAPTNESRFNKAGRVLVESLGGIDHEMFQIASYPLRDPATFGAFALGIGGLMLVDRQTTTAYQEVFHRSASNTICHA
ncbi:MAG: hypothetical protein P8X77_09870 [Maritimibacter sp.]